MGELAKNITFNIACLILGVILLLLGILGQVTVVGTTVGTAVMGLRVLLVVFGLLLGGIGGFFEYKRMSLENKNNNNEVNTTSTITTANSVSNDPPRSSAESFFYTTEDRDVPFTKMVEGARRVRIMSRTGVNLLSAHSWVFERLAQTGCEVQLLFVDPRSDAAKFVYGSNYEAYKTNIKSASNQLESLQRAMGRNLHMRVMDYAPTISIVSIEKESTSETFMQIQLYMFHGARGSDRPLFRVNYSDKWYRLFQKEFDEIWRSSNDWDGSVL